VFHCIWKRCSMMFPFHVSGRSSRNRERAHVPVRRLLRSRLMERHAPTRRHLSSSSVLRRACGSLWSRAVPLSAPCRHGAGLCTVCQCHTHTHYKQICRTQKGRKSDERQRVGFFFCVWTSIRPACSQPGSYSDGPGSYSERQRVRM
jgi:hypothetical protein